MVTRYLRPGLRRGNDRISQVPGEPRLSVCPVQPTPAGPRAPDRYGAAAWPLVCEQQRLPRKVFRRSIARRSGSLPTLRRVGYPDPTQDSLPAVGQTLLGGLLTRRAPTKGFRGVLVTSLPPFPSLLGAITSTPALVEPRCSRGGTDAYATRLSLSRPAPRSTSRRRRGRQPPALRGSRHDPARVRPGRALGRAAELLATLRKRCREAEEMVEALREKLPDEAR